MKPVSLISNNMMLPLKKWRRVVEVFKETDKNASLILISAFVEIAVNPEDEMSQAELTTKLGTVKPVVSAVVGQLGSGSGGPQPKRDIKPLGLIDIYVDPEDARKTRLKLTGKGRSLALAMRAALMERV